MPALFQYGGALLQDGQIEEAGRTFDRLVEVAPEAPEGWFGRARWLARRGDAAGVASALAAANERVDADAKRRLAEQGLQGDALERAAVEAARKSRAQMESDPAFAAFAADAEFRRAAGFAAR